ncbi:MAG: hypothetical protein VCD66_14675 [Alphaproteobacteria bacterium]
MTMAKVLLIAIAGVFLSTGALAGGWGGCSGQQKATTASSAPIAAPTTTAQTPIPKTTKPESKG